MSGIQERALADWFHQPDLDNLNKILESSKSDEFVNYFVYKIFSQLLMEQKESLNGFLSFNYFYEISGATTDQLDCFIEAVYVLVRYPFSILDQKFRVFDDSKQQWVVLESSMIEEAYKDEEFFHPLSGKEISKEVFNSIVNPYFELSEKGKAILNSSKVV